MPRHSSIYYVYINVCLYSLMYFAYLNISLVELLSYTIKIKKDFSFSFLIYDSCDTTNATYFI